MPKKTNLPPQPATTLEEMQGKFAELAAKFAEQEARLNQLEAVASTDDLTGLMNVRGFEKFFDYELAHIRRGNSPGALFVIVDLDRFGPLNDHHGHQAGDACLKFIADNLVKSIRLVDGAARLRGDEFAILLTQTDPERAVVRVNEIRRMLNEIRLEWKSERLHIAASFGVAPVFPGSDFNGVYNLASRALHEEKKLRRES